MTTKMTQVTEYKRLRNKANRLFQKWWRCDDKKTTFFLYNQYLKTLEQASAIAPSVDEVWEMTREGQ
ncbi:MAG: hypothetical protein ACYSYU_10945 [Planctomycetota bacterium]|jgi:hypothetical protein